MFESYIFSQSLMLRNILIESMIKLFPEISEKKVPKITEYTNGYRLILSLKHDMTEENYDRLINDLNNSLSKFLSNILIKNELCAIKVKIRDRTKIRDAQEQYIKTKFYEYRKRGITIQNIIDIVKFLELQNGHIHQFKFDGYDEENHNIPQILIY